MLEGVISEERRNSRTKKLSTSFNSDSVQILLCSKAEILIHKLWSNADFHASFMRQINIFKEDRNKNTCFSFPLFGKLKQFDIMNQFFLGGLQILKSEHEI